MRKLLRADLCRMCKSRVLMLCMLSAFAVSLIFTLRFALDTGTVKLVSWGSVMQTFPFMPILYAVFIGLFIGVEYQDRTLRNKLICGHSRLVVYFSLLVTVTLGCFAVIASWALGRVFDNILGNAAKYSDGDLSVTLLERGTVLFSNAAAGLGHVRAERLFDRFYTVESATGGVGLGLSIAKMLTERMGGNIGAEYSEGRLCIRLGFEK